MVSIAKPTPDDDALLRVFDRSGRFVQNFATIELLVVAWLMKMDQSEAAAKKFLHGNRWLDARVSRLEALLQDAGDVDAIAVAALILKIEAMRIFRNQFMHSPAGVADNGDMMLVGWKEIVAFSLEVLETHIANSTATVFGLNDAFLNRFGDHPSLQMAANAAPPPIG